MTDVIRLLPDSLANQIAAGEVVQRPASVVKELVENAIDAGSSSIQINIIDAGRTLIQVTDNGLGMSETDARMAFERHATSKIAKPEDLFSIRTMGFRGEALASIAAVAEVQLKTKREADNTGIEIKIQGSEFQNQAPAACKNGSNFMVKNLFFNTPARRKFLKADTTEFKHVLNEFQRVALAQPAIELELIHNNTKVYSLPQSNLKQRIAHLFGKNINSKLANINADTSMIKIFGYIGAPDASKKSAGEQFFFVNGRYMRHPYFHKAVMNAYDKVLPQGYYPSYFIYMETDPEQIDVNIHPTKTEIKFENEQAIFQILQASVKEGLGKYNLVPSIDFETSGLIDIPVLSKSKKYYDPEIKLNSNYNPFENESPEQKISSKQNLDNWEKLYDKFETQEEDAPVPQQNKITSFNGEPAITNYVKFIQLKQKYILTPVKSGLMLIDQKRAHERILFERFARSLNGKRGISQQCLFPYVIDINDEEKIILEELREPLTNLGFDMEPVKDNTLTIKGHPAEIKDCNPEKVFKELFQVCIENHKNVDEELSQLIALRLAETSAISYNKELEPEEMRELFDKLFACETPNFCPKGKTIVQIISFDHIEELF